jgi:hypothetical protein
METFGDTLQRLTRRFVADVVEAVLTEVTARAPKRRTVVRRIVRRTVPATVAPVVTLAPFEIPVGRRRARASGGPRRPRETKRLAPPVERPATFQVIPHPERTNRRLVLTRLG